MLNLDNYFYVPTPLLELVSGTYIQHGDNVYVYLGRHTAPNGYKLYVAREDDPERKAHWTTDTWKGNYKFTTLREM